MVLQGFQAFLLGYDHRVGVFLVSKSGSLAEEEQLSRGERRFRGRGQRLRDIDVAVIEDSREGER